MSSLTLIYGGVRSGKSSHAQSLVQGRVCYIATAHAGDEEMRRRIEKHRIQRPKDWKTVETLLHVDQAILDQRNKVDTILVDCMTLYLSNLMSLHDPDIPGEQELCIKILTNQLDKIISASAKFGGDVIFVSNETGHGIVPKNSLGRFYIDLSGLMNQVLANSCDHVIKMEVGIPVEIK